MKKSSLFAVLFILMFFFAAITLGGLGYAGKNESSFYWFAFAVNLVVYPTVMYALYKRVQKELKKEYDEMVEKNNPQK